MLKLIAPIFFLFAAHAHCADLDILREMLADQQVYQAVNYLSAHGYKQIKHVEEVDEDGRTCTNCIQFDLKFAPNRDLTIARIRVTASRMTNNYLNVNRVDTSIEHEAAD